MDVVTAELLKMGTTTEHFPTDGRNEIMLSGRSNVGKSSFINGMTNRKNLAYTSGRPGKTQTLNFYLINESFYFVDVPGYGYAKVSHKQREAFGKMIEHYIGTRKELQLAVLLVDFRHEPTEDDKLMYNFYKYYNIPVLVVATKLDKIGPTHRQRHAKVIKTSLGLSPDDYFVPYSSVTREGVDETWKIIEQFI